MKTVFYPGSFDPITLGHLDILAKSLQLFDVVVVGIGVHPGKTPLFSFAERAELIREAIDDKKLGNENHLKIVEFDNLTVDAAREQGADCMIRGLRDSTDLNYEMQLAGMNGAMDPALHTLFLPASPDVRPITATLVRQIAKMGGDYKHFVPTNVAAALAAKFNA